MKKVAVIGSGAWGTAVATVLAHNGYAVSLWCLEELVCNAILMHRENSHYLPGVYLHELIMPTTCFGDALEGARYVFQAVPVRYMRAVLTHFNPDQCWVSLSKGIEEKTNLLPTQILTELSNGTVAVACVAGASFAAELALHKPTAVAVGASSPIHAQEISRMLSNTYVRAPITDDLIGMQIGGALKNVIALFLGMLEGAGYGANTQAFALTEGLAEMATVAQQWGGVQDTAYGITGVGDLVLTCNSSLSKNRTLGIMIGAGADLQTAAHRIGCMPEGVYTARTVHELMVKHQWQLPLCAGVYALLYAQASVHEIINELFQVTTR